MTTGDTRIDDFLAVCGWAGAKRAPLAGDASARRYERVTLGARSAVLMDAPPEPGEAAASAMGRIDPAGYSAAARLAVDCRPYAALARHLVDCGFSAPTVYGQDFAQGLLLIEDLGDDLFVRLLERPDAKREEEFYIAAVDLLLALHAMPPPEQLALPGGETYALRAYDAPVYQVEADLLIEWFLPAALGRSLDEPERRAYHEAWRSVLPLADALPRVLALRDYHAGNLMWLGRRKGIKRVGLLDFQDGLVGSPAYDLVSLLQDARRDVSPSLERTMLMHYIARARSRRDFDEGRFRSAYAVLGAQRNAKIVGIFTRLSRRDGKPLYLGFLPRVWRYLSADLEHPRLAPLRDWFAQMVPEAARTRVPAPDEPGFAPLKKAAS
jgi:aminoglycoside/choline kinase family phosphotransferase